MAAISDLGACKWKYAFKIKRKTLAAAAANYGKPHIQQSMTIFVAGIL